MHFYAIGFFISSCSFAKCISRSVIPWFAPRGIGQRRLASATCKGLGHEVPAGIHWPTALRRLKNLALGLRLEIFGGSKHIKGRPYLLANARHRLLHKTPVKWTQRHHIVTAALAHPKSAIPHKAAFVRQTPTHSNRDGNWSPIASRYAHGPYGPIPNATFGPITRAIRPMSGNRGRGIVTVNPLLTRNLQESTKIPIASRDHAGSNGIRVKVDTCSWYRSQLWSLMPQSSRRRQADYVSWVSTDDNPEPKSGSVDVQIGLKSLA